jgi:large subunit ribosomal protein L10
MQKVKEVEDVKQIIQQYKVIAVASLLKVRGMQLQELKKKLRDVAHLRVVKNTIMQRAIVECKDKPSLEKLGSFLNGSNIFLFTNFNPFKLALLLEKSRVKTTAKAGDIASIDVIIPAGNTGLPPGPVISTLGSVGLPTRIEAGSVWVNKNTLVVKKGNVIEAKLASVLSKLNIKPSEAGLALKAAYEEGLVITEDQLHFDLGDFKKSIIQAQANALNLSLNSGYPTTENIQLLIQMAHRKAYNLALSATVPTKETIGALLRKANTEALNLSVKLTKDWEKVAVQSPTQSSSESSVQKS